ncbi:15056_t:CDS:2 [Acaulospora morrowiae]|uniref:15056_t:CDS:1 n=1 Tax=Acaulospora morrowiae TaxID=94023 RepID=A0A9N8V2W4_9GLOM|nr:15056_t:CDS:2 [Acaulospora morrowiae]
MSQLYSRVLLLTSLLVGLLALIANGDIDALSPSNNQYLYSLPYFSDYLKYTVVTFTATVIGPGTTFTTTGSFTGTETPTIPPGFTVYVDGQTLTADGSPTSLRTSIASSSASGTSV